MGRLCNAISFDRFIKVCRRLKQERLDFHLWILDEGENYNQLTLEVKQLNLEGTVKFLELKRESSLFKGCRSFYAFFPS
ncbi:hypothetical protein [Bacteroidetes bacterium endosymbiont of Geopemphigus sp.]|uniref:hypothetical protein n=1 Tax=Bacteroidetes bacterium endosymbiont of Geopemphigus sp. TaxID=2047937 RepID=UPI000CD05EBC